MSSYFRLLAYVRPYWRKVILLFVTVTIFAGVSGVSLTLIHPFMKIVLSKKPEVPVEPAAPSSSLRGIPLPSVIDNARERVQAWFESRMYAGDPRQRLSRFCGLLLLLFLVKAVFSYLQTYLTTYLEQKVLYQVRNDVYGHIQELPLSFFDKEKTGHIISRITNDVSTLRGAVIGAAASFVRNGLMTIIGISVVLAVSWKLALVTFIVIPINLLLIGFIGGKLKKRSFRTQEHMAEMTALLEENVSGMRVVKAFSMGDYEKGRFAKFNLKYMRQFLRMKLWGAVSSPTSELLGTFAIVVILWYGGNLVLNGAISPENLMLFVVAIIWVVTPVKTLSKLNNTIQESVASAQRVFSILDLQPEPLRSTRGGPEAKFSRSIRFESVNFEYVPGRPVLRDITFDVKPGEVVALVGASGAGKSTLVDLIPRFYDPTSGQIVLDDIDISELNLESLRRLMGIVTQEIILFNDTVESNIAYGINNCSRDKIAAAAEAANAHGFIEHLPMGYDTVIGERGTQLSGGQRQRISIARAILKDPEVLIFDEATSALDTESEILVQQAIDRLLAGRTTFVIAHRLSTIHHADKILVLEKGSVLESGTHDQLMRRDGAYKKLHDLQFGLVS